MDTNKIRQYWNTWLWRDAVTRIITINFIVWLVVIAGVWLDPTPLKSFWLGMFSLPNSWHGIFWRPWTPITYMFSHYDFIHMLANMLWLMLFGDIVMRCVGGVRLTALYIYGGVAGAVGFLTAVSLMPTTFHGMMGASCSVLALGGAVWVLVPDWEVNLFIFGRVKLKWICLAAAIFFVAMAPTADNMAAHGAGMLTGVCYALLRRSGIDILTPMVVLLDALQRIFSRKPVARPAGKASYKHTSDSERELDALLDKINRSGYASLTAAERQRLFDLSQRKNRF